MEDAASFTRVNVVSRTDPYSEETSIPSPPPAKFSTKRSATADRSQQENRLDRL